MTIVGALVVLMVAVSPALLLLTKKDQPILWLGSMLVGFGVFVSLVTMPLMARIVIGESTLSGDSLGIYAEGVRDLADRFTFFAWLFLATICALLALLFLQRSRHRMEMENSKGAPTASHGAPP